MIHPVWSLFKIKFCGFRSLPDTRDAIDVGTGAIGFNFYRPGPRYVEPSAAGELSRLTEDRTQGKVLRVGVFVNPTIGELRQTLASCPLDMIQLHGDETPEMFCDEAPMLPIIKAVTWREGSSEDGDRAAMWAEAGKQISLAGFLVDAYDPVQRGGTGKTARWDLLYPRPSPFSRHPLILAGGLRPDNVRQAIVIAKPDAVDTASGIESAPGLKNLDKMRSFVDQARIGFAEIEPR